MTNTETVLIRNKMKPENAKKMVAILEEFWKNGNTDCDYYRNELKKVTVSLNLIELAEDQYAKEFTAYDEIFRIPRLKTDPNWPKILQMTEEVHRTGRCPFCSRKMFAIDNRQICRPCDRAFGIKKKGIFDPADPNTIFVEAANG
jgi:hypothetical protein